MEKDRAKIENYLNQVIQGDCLAIMPDIPNKSVDMILCDLPYGTTQNKWDSVIDLSKLWQEYTRILKDSGVIALTSQGLFTAKLIMSNEEWFKYKIVWIKSKSTNFLNAKKQPLRKHEDICIFYKQQPTYNPQMTDGEAYDKGFRKDQYTGSYGDFKPRHVKSNGERYPNDVVCFEEHQPIEDFVYFKTAESEGTVYHPTQKPVELGRYLIRTFTNKGDIVLDNACGSGSFLLSALLEERQYIGIEKNENVLLHKVQPIDYIKVCNDRINEVINHSNNGNVRFQHSFDLSEKNTVKAL
ncbi:MAG: site-specific DNA-methyltransferase [Bacteroidales bacterium]|jgi:DNA modification methylase|nr:site-specific DNA-methyltransferase [Bacteroidales bacterium]